MNNMWMLIFLLLPVIAIAYIGWHLGVLVPLNVAWRCTLIGLLAASFGMLFVSVGRMIDSMPLPMARTIYEIGTSSLIFLLYIVIFFLVLDLLRLVGIVPRQWLFHNFYTTVVLVVGLFMLFMYGNIHYHNKVRESFTLTTAKPLDSEKRIFMASDLHLGYHNPRHELARWVDIINSEKPDLVLIAGDIIDMSMRPLTEEQMAEEFKRIEAPIYACLGNHEYYSRVPEARKFYREAGIHLLSDESVVADGLTIIGRDDRTNQKRASLKEITAKADMNRFTILLDHQPYHLEEAEQAGIDFQFSGHTHHGQVWPASCITESLYECAFGHHRRGNTEYYVSSGLGIWGGKYRIGTRSEYVVVTIKK